MKRERSQSKRMEREKRNYKNESERETIYEREMEGTREG